MKMTRDRLAVLKAIDGIWDERGLAPDHHLIAIRCGREYHQADWAHGKLRALLDGGLIEIVGHTMGARTYRLTVDGRLALSKAVGM